MKVHVLIENTTSRGDLVAEHGLSLLIETEAGLRLLFDAGATPAFAENAVRMGADLATVDVAVLSHGHNDHGGGLGRFMELNTQAAVWVTPHAFDAHYNANGREIGLPQAWKACSRFCVATQDSVALAPGVSLCRATEMPMLYSAEGAGMKAVVHGRLVVDDFRHEQYLFIEEKGKKVLFSGCSHRGILNIATYFKPDVLVGGFHYMRCHAVADAARLQQAAQLLLALPTQYYTGHCTGETAMAILSPIMGERLHSLSTGMQLEL